MRKPKQEKHAYDARVALWLSRDPIEERGGVDLHGFIYNSPVYGIDPDGRFGIVGAVLGAVVEIGMQVSMNYIAGEIFLKIDVKNVVIAALVGAVAPGFLSVAKKSKAAFDGTKRYKQTIEVSVKARHGRLKGPDAVKEATAMRKRIVSKIRNHNKLVEDALVAGGTLAAWQASKFIAKKVADEVEGVVRELSCLGQDWGSTDSEVITLNVIFSGGSNNVSSH